MSLHLKNKIIFIHIPKTGGSSIENHFTSSGDIPAFYCNKGTKFNGHSPQHSTYSELNSIGLIPEGFGIVSIVRHPYERFCSEFNYLKTFGGYNKTLKEFTNEFFGGFVDFDNHNNSCFSFLNGCLDRVIIIRYENLIEELSTKLGIKLDFHELNSKKFITPEQLNYDTKEIIYRNWKEDFQYFNYER